MFCWEQFGMPCACPILCELCSRFIGTARSLSLRLCVFACTLSLLFHTSDVPSDPKPYLATARKSMKTGIETKRQFPRAGASFLLADEKLTLDPHQSLHL